MFRQLLTALKGRRVPDRVHPSAQNTFTTFLALIQTIPNPQTVQPSIWLQAPSQTETCHTLGHGLWLRCAKTPWLQCRLNHARSAQHADWWASAEFVTQVPSGQSVTTWSVGTVGRMDPSPMSRLQQQAQTSRFRGNLAVSETLCVVSSNVINITNPINAPQENLR